MSLVALNASSATAGKANTNGMTHLRQELQHCQGERDELRDERDELREQRDQLLHENQEYKLVIKHLQSQKMLPALGRLPTIK